MALSIRPATDADLDAIVALTAARRRRLASWSPTWWNPSAAADELHPLWLRHLLDADGPVVRVADDAGAIVACAVSVPQGEQWFVDDVAAADERWAEPCVALFDAVPERPALTCVPTLDVDGGRAAQVTRLDHVSSYWFATPEGDEPPAHALPHAIELSEPPAHTFGEACDPTADGALAVAVGDGVVTGSPSLPAPPVYDPGGTVAVVDRVQGPDGPLLLKAARAAAARRGDVVLSVVASVGDAALRDALEDEGFEQTVDVYRWPEQT